MEEPRKEKAKKLGSVSRNIFIHNPIYRAERKRKLLEYVKKATGENDETLDEKKLVALFSWKWGISNRRIGEYVEELEILGAIVRRGDRIKFSDIGEQLLSMDV